MKKILIEDTPSTKLLWLDTNKANNNVTIEDLVKERLKNPEPNSWTIFPLGVTVKNPNYHLSKRLLEMEGLR